MNDIKTQKWLAETPEGRNYVLSNIIAFQNHKIHQRIADWLELEAARKNHSELSRRSDRLKNFINVELARQKLTDLEYYYQCNY